MNPAERDKQPSQRYIDRLAEFLVPRIMDMKGLVDYAADEATLDSLRRQLHWLIRDAGVDMRKLNEDR
jgi:hypothetical protein